jgi:CelD/BcsL family acetyltransferase involved in cellulose biosynthesis
MGTVSTETFAPSRTAFSLEPLAGFESAREEWAELAAASGNVFLTSEWLGAWWQTFGEGHELVLQMVRREDGSAAAILPLYRDYRPPTALRMVGHTQSDLLGPVCAPEDRDLAAFALQSFLAEEGSSVFVGNSLPASENWTERLGGRAVDSMTSPSLVFEGRDWEQIFSGCSKNFRRNSGKAQRRLERDYEVAWRVATPQTAAADLEQLIELHRARWGAESGSFEGLWAELHRRFVVPAAEAGWLRLVTLEADGRPVAAYYNLRFGATEVSYQYGRDPEFARYELGTMADIHGMRSAIEAGLSEYGFLRGPEAYKDRFANRDDPVETVVVPLGLGARALPSLVRLAPRLPNAIRRRVTRLVSGLMPATASLGDLAAESNAVYLMMVV